MKSKLLVVFLLLLLGSCSNGDSIEKSYFEIYDSERQINIVFLNMEIQEQLKESFIDRFVFRDVLTFNISFENRTDERLIIENYELRLENAEGEPLAKSDKSFFDSFNGIEFQIEDVSVGANKGVIIPVYVVLSIDTTFKDFGEYTVYLYEDTNPYNYSNEIREIGSFKLLINSDREVELLG